MNNFLRMIDNDNFLPLDYLESLNNLSVEAKHEDMTDVLNNFTSHLKFDARFYKKIKNFRISWLQKDPIYIEFMGGVLTGVHPIRFSSRDEDILFNDIFELDISDVREALHATHGIDPKWHISSNPIYLTLIYMMYRFTNSKDIGRYKDDVITELYYIFSYKVLGSLIQHYFKYDAPVHIAKATYEKLSNRYLIKKYDSWGDVLEHRSHDLLKGGLHFDRIRKLNTDNAIRIANDLQGRIREIIKNIYSVMIEVIEHNERIVSESAFEDNGSGEEYKGITNRPDKYIIYAKDVVTNNNDFINDDIIYLISKLIPTINEDLFRKSLYGYTEFYNSKERKYDSISIIIEQSIAYINSKGIVGDYNKHVLEIIKLLKGYWGTTTKKDKILLDAKEELYIMVRHTINKKTGWVIVPIVIGIMIYIFIRSLAK